MTTPTTNTGPGTFKPVSGSERIQSIDVVRGFALLGILVVNSLFFALPLADAMGVPEPAPGTESVGIWQWIAFLVVMILFQYKFMSLFSLLFGVGAAIQFERATRAGRRFGLFFLCRLLILFCIGAIHAVFFWYGDILAQYALIGVWLLLFCRLRPVALVIIGTGLLTIAALIGGTIAGFEATMALDPEYQKAMNPDGTLPVGWLDTMEAAMWNPESPIWRAGELRAYGEGPYIDLFMFRLVTWLFAIVFGFLQFGWHIMAMFAFGVALYKSGFFGDEGGRLRCWAVAVALPIGLLLELGAMLPDWTTPVVVGMSKATHEYGSTLMAFGYAALVTTIVRGGQLRMIAHVIACTGRMALTVYLAETVIMTSLFYSYGFGLFGEVDRIWLIPISLGTWIALAVFSTLWLGSFKQGPMEWLWRVLSYGISGSRG